jgi:alkyl hydroperoxide reductase subunit F
MALDFRLPGPGFAAASSKARTASETEVYDVVIVGGGPAGTTAVVYACRKGLNTLLVSENIGGQLLWTSGVENFPGFQYVTGPELKAKFEAQIRQFPLALELGTRVAHLEKTASGFLAVTENGRRFQSRTVIIATGRNPRRLGIPGEQEFTGKGVTYCATCDAPLYAGQDVAVIGGGNSALTSILDLAGVTRTVYSIHRRTEYRGDAVLISKVESSPNVKRRLGYEPTAIKGADRVSGVELHNLAGGALENLAVSGVFIEIGSEPVTDFARDLLKLPATSLQPPIVTNCRTETAIPGLFAAGDATTVFENQIVIAAGEGAKAALAAHAWLLSRPKPESAK